MEENQNRILLLVTIAAILIGGVTLWVQYKVKSRKPVIGWHNLGTETFDLKPSAYKTFTYRELPAKFRVEVHANAPVSFGFVTPDTYGHFTSTVLKVNFASQPCGSAPVTSADLNCATDSSKRYLLVTDSREESIPEAKNHSRKTAAPVETSAQADNHVTLSMYDWRCIQYCENLPRS